MTPSVLISGIVFAGSIGWLLYAIWPMKIVVNDRWIVKRCRFKTERLRISDLSEIKFHYHAVVGFAAVWEFMAFSGKTISADASGIEDRLLIDLERHVPNFSRTKFRELFDTGDVEDTLEVWKASLP